MTSAKLAVPAEGMVRIAFRDFPTRPTFAIAETLASLLKLPYTLGLLVSFEPASMPYMAPQVITILLFEFQ